MAFERNRNLRARTVGRAALMFIVSASFSVFAENPLDPLKFRDGDEIGNEIRALQTEVLVSSTELKAVQQMNLLLKKYKGTPVEPDLWFRLAELHMRRSKSQRFFEMQRVSETLVSFLPVQAKASSSKAEIKKAIQYYEVIKKRFSKYPRMDLVFFNQAFALQSLGNGAAAEKVYWGLIQNFSKSALVPDSHLAIGELSFSRNNFRHALEHFTAVERYPLSKVFPYGMYKAGWSYYNLQKAPQAISKLEEVIKYGEKIEAEKLDSRLDLRREALNDLTIFFEDVFPSKKAFGYFEKLSGNLDVEPVLMRLSGLYERHSRWNDKETVLTDLLRNRPLSPAIPEILASLVKNSDDMKNKELAVDFLAQLSDHCQSNKKWAKMQARKLTESSANEVGLSKVEAECNEIVSTTSLKFASKWLRTWKKNSSFLEFANAAQKAFNIFLINPPKTKEAEEARFAYAELLFALKDYRGASSQYALVGSGLAGESLGPISHDADYAAVVSLEKAAGDKWNDQDEKSFHSLAQKYLTSHPKGEFVLDVEFKLGLIAYDNGKYEEAGPIFLRLGRTYPKSEKGLKAQDLYLDILNLQKDFAGLKAFSKELLAGTTEGSQRAEKLSTLYRQAYFLEIQTFEEKGDLEKALGEYKQFAEENLNTDLGKSALWNAITISNKLNLNLESAELGVLFFNRYPNDEKAKKALLSSIDLFEAMAKLEDAAINLLRLAKVDSELSLKWKLLAAKFFHLGNKPARAKALLVALAERGNESERRDATELWASLEERSFSKGPLDSDLERHIVELKLQPFFSLILVSRVEELFKTAQFERAFIDAKSVLNLGDSAIEAKGRARLVQALILKKEFEAQSVKSRSDRVALVLGLKTEKLEKAQSAFQAVIRFKHPESTILAMEGLAELYLHYVTALRTMPTPDGLSGQDEKLFRAEIDQLILPLEEKGVEAVEQALKQVQELKPFGSHALRLRKRLDELNLNTQPRLVVEIVQPQPLLPIFSEGPGA